MVKAEQAAGDISRDVENANVVVRKLDLADTKSICDFAELIYNSELRMKNSFLYTSHVQFWSDLKMFYFSWKVSSFAD